MDNESKKSNSINSAIYILLLTVVSYAGAYIYELSYLKNFAAPSEFIKVNINQLIISGLAITFISTLILQIMSFFAIFTKEHFKESCFAFIFEKYGITFFPVIILSFLSDMSYLSMFYFIIITHPMMWIHLISAIFMKKRFGSYKEAFFHSVDIEVKPGLESDGVKAANYSNYTYIIFFSFYFLFAAGVAGYQSSANKDEFLVDNKNRILLRSYDGTAIMGFMDKEKLTQRFVIADIKGLELEKKKMNIVVIKEPSLDDKVMQTLKSIYSYLKNLSGD